MKNLNKTLLVASLAVAGIYAWQPAQAEIAQTELVQADAITQEAPVAEAQVDAESALQEETIIIKKPKKAAAPKRRVIIQEVEEAQAEPTMISAQVAATTTVAQQAQAGTAGSKIDASITKAVDGVKLKIEDKIVSMLDRIKITVDEDAPNANVIAPVGTQAPVTTTIVQDSVVNTAAAPAAGASIGSDKGVYQPLEASASQEADGTVAAKAEEEAELQGKVKIFPLAGVTTLSSDLYDIDSRYTAGAGLEIELGAGLAFAATYSYSQYDVGLGVANPYFGYWNGSLGMNNTQKLEYNQNVFDATLRLYLLPKSSRFRFFIGAGPGFNKGYLNYDQRTLNAWQNTWANSNGALDDYEVTSFLGIAEAGGDIQLSKSLSVGASFKYATVLSSRENKPINNNGFVANPYNYAAPTEKSLVGGSIAGDGFYSLLGNIKFSF